MDRQLIEVIIIDELVDRFLEGKQYVLAESQQNMINELVTELVSKLNEDQFGSQQAYDRQKKELIDDLMKGGNYESRQEAAADADNALKDAPGAEKYSKPKDDSPGKLDAEEKAEASSAKSDLMKTLKQKGIVGAAAQGVGKVANKVFTALFGQGVYQRREDAEQMIKQAAQGQTPAEAAKMLYRSMYRLKPDEMPGPGPAPGPDPEPEPEGDGSGGGSEFAVPVFKKFSGADQEKGAHPRSLSSQLMKLFPNVPKSAITQILKGVAAQLKTNKVAIQENKHIVAKVLIENLETLNEEGDFLKPSMIKGFLKKLRKKLRIPFNTQDLLNNLRNVLKDAQPPSGLEPLRVPGGPANLDERAATPYVVALQDLHKAAMNSKLVDNEGKATNRKISPDDAYKIAEEFSTWLEEGQKGANIAIDRGQEDPEEEEAESPEEEAPGEESGEGGDAGQDTSNLADESREGALFDKFRKILKRLDLHTSEGRKAAKASDAAYLGAYKYYKSMKLAYDAIKKGKIVGRTDDLGLRIDKLLTPLNELQGENEFAAGKDLKTWLGNMINIFDEAGLNDPQRGMKASKAARGASNKGISAPQKKTDGSMETPEEVVKRVAQAVKDGKASKQDLAAARQAAKAAGDETARMTGKAGSVNARQSVGPQLKAAGINLKSPEGQALQKKMLKVIRRFLNKNMQRMGKQDIKIISEKIVKELQNRGIIT